jgi:uncharacterized protein YuzE
MPMTVRYDPETDAIYMILSDKKVWESEELEKDVVVDYDCNDEVVAIEILNVKENDHRIDLPIVLKSA